MLVNTISTGCSIGTGLAYINPGIGQGSVAVQIVEGIARQPEQNRPHRQLVRLM